MVGRVVVNVRGLIGYLPRRLSVDVSQSHIYDDFFCFALGGFILSLP